MTMGERDLIRRSGDLNGHRSAALVTVEGRAEWLLNKATRVIPASAAPPSDLTLLIVLLLLISLVGSDSNRCRLRPGCLGTLASWLLGLPYSVTRSRRFATTPLSADWIRVQHGALSCCVVALLD